MKFFLKKFKQISVTAMLVMVVNPIFSQVKTQQATQKKQVQVSKQLKEFLKLAAEANVVYDFPKGFKEIKAPSNEYFSFDYALSLPGKEFEIWLRIENEKENWASYLHNQNDQSAQLSNPDSTYNALGAAQAIAFTGDKNYFVRSIPADVLARYNADAGKSYLLTLLDLPETKHYKYALLITLQKNHTGTILAVCFTNEKGPEFFKNMDKASHCLKFKS